MKFPRPTLVLIILCVFLFAINGYIFLQAIEHAWLYYTPSLNYASVFSSYYDSAWALIHNPSNVYGHHNFPVAHSQDFRYPPWFLLFVLPFLSLPFPLAQDSFELLQFLLLPLIALLVFKIIRPSNKMEFLLTAIVLFFTLLEPLIGTTFSIGVGSPYFQQYTEGQSKVLELFFILAALYLAKKGSILAPILLVLGAFDPRFTVMALPLFLYFFIKSRSFSKLVFGTFFSVLIAVPFAYYNGVLGQFLRFHQYAILTFYTYEWVLFYPILALSLAILLKEVNEKYRIDRHVTRIVRSNPARVSGR